MLDLYAADAITAGLPGNPSMSERGLELAFARRYLADKPAASVLEVGCVTPYYWESEHGVIDLGDTHSRAVGMDVRDVGSWSGLHVLSISTLEHVESGMSELLAAIISDSASCLLTLPLGWRAGVDDVLRGDWTARLAKVSARWVHYRRTNAGWVIVPSAGLLVGTYDKPFRYANDVIVIWKGAL